jgi:metallophosphoesterase (TIGR00282 family)
MLKQNNVVRPININPSCPQASVGVGTLVFKYKNTSVRLTNILGNTVYMNDENFLTNSFASLKALLPAVKEDIHIVDLHAETTSEKNAFLSEFSGQVSAILGTHTHVQTNDQKIYNNTVYITDVGMTGPSHGIIGGEPSSIIEMFEGKSHRFKLNEDNSSYQFNAVVLEFDKKNKPIDIKNIVIYEK